MAITTGYKATDKNMRCQGLQFALGEWQGTEDTSIDFCTQLAHTYDSHFNDSDRRFECEVEDVLGIVHGPGVILKRVARRIKLTKELTIPNYGNVGSANTGSSNTGSSNVGSCNVGHSNVGSSNTGSGNTGSSNVGDGNVGSSNTGNSNIGSSNTGSNNTGSNNTGSSNVGDGNVGDGNVGGWNNCSYSTGFFGSIDPKTTSFDVECDYTRAEFLYKFGVVCMNLHKLMQSDGPIDVADFAEIPNITQQRLNNLHQKYIDNRANN